jgi:hypothetical protein
LFIRQIRSRENRLARPREEARGAATAHDLHRGAAETVKRDPAWLGWNGRENSRRGPIRRRRGRLLHKAEP